MTLIKLKIDFKSIFIETNLLDKTIDLLFKDNLYSFKIHTASSSFDYKFGDVFSGNMSECNNPGPILTKFMDDLAKEKTIVSESKEEVDDVVSEYLDNTEYDAIMEYIANKTSKKDMSTVVSKKDNSFLTYLPKDFKQRVFDLSFLVDIDNKLETSPFVGIIQQELLLSRNDKEMIGDLDSLTFEQLIELFTMLASMKGMIKVLNKDTNEWILVQQKEKLSLCSEICNVVNNDANSMLEESKFDDAIDKTRIEPEKQKLTCNGIHLADIESIKIEKFGVLLIRLDVEEGYFGKDSRKCRWDLCKDIDEAVDVLRKYHGTSKVYSRLKYTSNSSKLFSNVVPEISKKSFGKIFKVLIDVDSLFYIARTWNMDVIECKKIEYLEQHNAKVTNKELHSAIEVPDSDIESRYNIEPYIAIPQVEEIKTSYTMAAIKDGQYLFVDDSTFKIGEDRSAAFNSILRAEGHKEEVFYVLYKNLDKVGFNYYIGTANAKDKIISAVYVSSSYSDYNKNIALREHQKADIEDIKLDVKIEKKVNDKTTRKSKSKWTIAILKDGKSIFVRDDACTIGVDKKVIIKKHAALDIGPGYEEEEFVIIDKEIDKERFDFFTNLPSAAEKQISEIHISKEFLNDEAIIVLAKTKRENDNNKAELIFARRGDTEYNKRLEDGTKYAVLFASPDNELYNAIKNRVKRFVSKATLEDYEKVRNLFFMHAKTCGNFDNIHNVYVDINLYYKIKDGELDDAQCLADTELDSLETTQIELDGYKKLTSQDYTMITPEDDIFKCPEILKFKNEFTGTGIISDVEPTKEMRRMIDGNPIKYRLVLENNSRKQSANNAQEDEMVFIITPRENDIFDIVYKSKSELETNEEFINYRTKFINPSSNLFALIKNHLLYMAESDNYSLTKEQISSVSKIYVPSHTIGLHYKITPAAGVFSLDIIFSYSLQEYDSIDNLELQRGRNARKAFYDFKEEE